MCLLRRSTEAGSETWNTGPPYDRNGQGLYLKNHHPSLVPVHLWDPPPIGTMAHVALSSSGISALNTGCFLVGMHTETLLEFEIW